MSSEMLDTGYFSNSLQFAYVDTYSPLLYSLLLVSGPFKGLCEHLFSLTQNCPSKNKQNSKFVPKSSLKKFPKWINGLNLILFASVLFTNSFFRVSLSP